MTKPYQPSFSIQPTYGFRYMSQPFAPNVGNINSANTGIIPNYEYKPDYKVPDKPVSSVTPQVIDSGDDNQTIDDPTNRINVASDLGYKDVYGPDNPAAIIPGYGMLSSISGPAVPKTGFGSPDSVSSITGGIFDEDSRSYNPITGEYNQEYGTSKAFTDYMLSDPMGNIFGDTKNAFDYQRDEEGNRTGLASASFEKAMVDSPLAKDGLTETEKNLIAKDIGRDMGFSESTLRDDGPTLDAIKGEGYDPITGAAPRGSQFSSTGTFSTAQITDDSYGSNATEDNVTNLSTKTSTGTSYADDAQSSGSGGGK